MQPVVIPICVGFVVFLTHALQAAAGFGAVVLALPFLAALIGVKTAVPALVVIGLFFNGFIVLANRKKICWRELVFIVLYAAVAMPLGLAALDMLPEKWLKLVLAGFMLGVGAWNFRRSLRDSAQQAIAQTKNWRMREHVSMRGVLVAGGLIHGVFASGGPFFIVYAAKAVKEKGMFRATLAMLWLGLSTIMLTQWVVSARMLTGDVFRYVVVAAPFVAAGLYVGDKLHHRVKEKTFRMLIYAILFAGGAVVLCNALLGYSK